MSELISSLQNPRIKNILKLDKPSERKAQNLFVLEGIHEFKHACQAGYSINSVFWCPEILPEPEFRTLVSGCLAQPPIYEVTQPVFEKISYRGGTGGICALAVPVFRRPGDLQLGKAPLILVLEAVEKPGNLGAILRSADGAGIDAVIIADPHTDLYNPNVIRSSVGCLFTVQTAMCTGTEALSFFKERGIRSLAAALPARKFYHEEDYRQGTAFIMGTEATGLSSFWLEQADGMVKIPMLGGNDSLNVSISSAILIYEAQRQRGFLKGKG
ncbi:MAG: RNA methyltransferase [Bacteroidales bacterium]